MDLFQIKKNAKPGLCHAMRCTESHQTDTIMHGRPWNLPGAIFLCRKHLAMAESWKNAEDGSESVALVPAGAEIEASKAVGWPESSSWLARVYEVLQELNASAEEGTAVVEVAKGLTVEGHADLSDIAVWAQDVQAKIKAVVTLEKEITSPLATALARIRELTKPAKQAWADAGHLLRAHLEAAALQQAERNKSAAQDAEALVRSGEDPTAALERMTHTTDLSGVSLRLRWRAVVEDVSRLPEAYVIRIPNDKKLKEHCAEAGDDEPRAIPGVRFEREVASRILASK
jgi:hypothetical protein